MECKATTGNAKSMRTVMSHPEKYHVTNAIKLGDYNIGRKDQLLTLPMYMAKPHLNFFQCVVLVVAEDAAEEGLVAGFATGDGQ